MVLWIDVRNRQLTFNYRGFRSSTHAAAIRPPYTPKQAIFHPHYQQTNKIALQ